MPKVSSTVFSFFFLRFAFPSPLSSDPLGAAPMLFETDIMLYLEMLWWGGAKNKGV